MRITHEDIERDLDALTEWPHSVVYELAERDVLTESFTSTRGRVYGGPATITIIEGRDGITVRVRRKPSGVRKDGQPKRRAR